MNNSALYQYINSHLERVLHLARQRKDALFAADDVDALKAYQRQVVQTLTAAVGPIDTPRPTGFEELGQFSVNELIVQRVVYQAAPGVSVPALIYQRQDLRGQQPGVLFLCGHEIEGKQETRYQEVCQLLAQQGLVVLCPDIAGQGERTAYVDDEPLRPTHAHDAAGLAAFAQGQNPMRWFMRDAMAALTVLCGLAQVDAKRLMVTGNSGGGTQSIVLALLDDRVKAAAVGTYLSSQQAIWRSGKPQDAEQVWPNTLTLEHTVDHDDLMMAFAPKLLLVLAAEQDFFPIEGLHDSVSCARRAYSRLGSPANLQLYQENVTHQYTHGMALAVGQFAKQHLGLPQCGHSPEPKAVASEALWSTKRGSVQHGWGSSLDLKALCRPTKYAVNEQAVIDGITACLPERPPSVQIEPMVDWHGLTQERIVCTNDDFTVEALLFVGQHAAPASGCDLYLFDKGLAECEANKHTVLSGCEQGKRVLVCALPGMSSSDLEGTAPDAMFGWLYQANSWLMRLGKSLAGLRTAALIQLIRYIKDVLQCPVTVHAQGPLQIYARYAQIFGETFAINPEGAHDLQWLYQQLMHPKPDHTLWQFILPGVFAGNRHNGKEGTT